MSRMSTNFPGAISVIRKIIAVPVTTEPCSTNGWPRRLQRVLYGKTIGSFGVATCGVRATGSRTRLERQPTDPTNLLAH